MAAIDSSVPTGKGLGQTFRAQTSAPLCCSTAPWCWCASLMLFPVFSTLLLSFKQQSDVRRLPPTLFPCNTPARNFDLSACRFCA